jgi:hypothetical protein
MRFASFVYASLALAFWVFLIPAVLPYAIPAAWWYEIRDVRVDSDTTAVTLDRTVHALPFDPVMIIDGREVRTWIGEVRVVVRQVGINPATGEMVDDGRIHSSCPGKRTNIPYSEGMSYSKVVRDTGQPRTLAWFMDAPPNSGCTLVPGSYVADFTWSRTFLWFDLSVSKSSNIFTMTRRLEMDRPE